MVEIEYHNIKYNGFHHIETSQLILELMQLNSITCANLTLKDPFISKSCIEIKALKAFIKPFEAPQRSAKIKI